MGLTHAHDENLPADTFVIEVSFDPDKDNLSQTLAALSRAVNGHALSNNIISHAYDQEVSTQIVLENIEKKCIKLLIKNIFLNTESKHIQEKGVIAFANQAIIEVRAVFLDYLAKNNAPNSPKEIAEIREKIAQLPVSKNTDGLAPKRLEDTQIIDCLGYYSKPDGLTENQDLQVRAAGRDFTVSRSVRIASQERITLLAGSSDYLPNQQLRVRVKKPDFLGKSKWTFQEMEGHTFDAHIGDEPWLTKFQNGLLLPHEFPYPQEVLIVNANIRIQRDRFNVEIGREYEIIKVLGVVKESQPLQPLLQ